MKKSAFFVVSKEELSRHLEAHHNRIKTAKSCVDCAVPNSMVKHIKGRHRVRGLAREVTQAPHKRSCERGPLGPYEELQATGSVESSPHGKAGNAALMRSFSLQTHSAARCQCLDPSETASLRYDLYHTRTGKMAAQRRRHLQQRNVVSLPPWKPPGLSSLKSPCVDSYSSSIIPKNSKAQQKVSLCSTSLCETLDLSSTIQPSHQKENKTKRVSFFESSLPTPDGSYVEHLSKSIESSSVDTDVTSYIESLPSEVLSNLLPEATPTHLMGMCSNLGSPNHSTSFSPSGGDTVAPSSPSGGDTVDPPPPLGGNTPSPSGGDPPSPLGGDTVAPPSPSGGDTVAPPSPSGGDTVTPPWPSSTSFLGSVDCKPPHPLGCHMDQLLSEAAGLSQRTEELTKGLEEARIRIANRRKEGQYLSFLSEVTKDILSRGVLSRAALDVLFASHVESKSCELDRDVLLRKIRELKLQLGIAD